MSVSLPGAAVPEFDIETFKINITADDETDQAELSFQLQTSEIERAAPDDREERPETDLDDWENMDVWENYGPDFSIDSDFGSLKTSASSLESKLPLTIEFGDQDDKLGCHCMDHQELVQNTITFVSMRTVDNTTWVTVDWRAMVMLDGRADRLRPVRIQGEARLEHDRSFRLFGAN